MVVCVHLPRFELTVAAAGGAQALAGRALAVAPAPGAEARVGEVSGAAEAFGVVREMVLGEALARCPQLRLMAGDPLGVACVATGDVHAAAHAPRESRRPHGPGRARAPRLIQGGAVTPTSTVRRLRADPAYEVPFPHPSLGGTLGTIVFQDQVLEVGAEVGAGMRAVAPPVQSFATGRRR
jgi:hypothetical protein